MRALRVDKLTYAALEATLEEFAAGRAAESVPVCAMLALTPEAIGRRADALAAVLSSRGMSAEVVDGHSMVGGGSAPGSTLPTRVVVVTHPSLSASQLEDRLRSRPIPVIARIEHDRLLLDLRTVDPADDAALGEAVSGGDERH
jgi:L-seryl-tRNA(Ser) seleniumtransferase